jgi:hypothetical protein
VLIATNRHPTGRNRSGAWFDFAFSESESILLLRKWLESCCAFSIQLYFVIADVHAYELKIGLVRFGRSFRSSDFAQKLCGPLRSQLLTGRL